MDAWAELRREVAARGLLDPQPRYYATLGVVLGSALLAGYAALALAPQGIQLANAVFLAVVYGRLSLVAHDASHRQVFATARANDRLGLLLVLIQGLSWSWWVDKHLRHHRAPNVVGSDPDIEVPGLAFSPSQARSRGPLSRWVIRRLAPFAYVPILAAQTVGWTVDSARFLVRRRIPGELALLVAHHVLYVGFVLAALGTWGLPFAAVHKGLWSLYLSAILAPNHQGMPLLADGADFPERQVLTTRSVSEDAWTTWWFGGLNHHVEHHLFPSMPRNNLRHVRPLVRRYCAEVGLPYRERTVREAHRDIAEHLRAVAASP